jgi:NTE family protein
MSKKAVGLVLGGGATRGFAHIGVIKVLEEAEIPVDYVAGASIGSVIGAAYCAGFGWREIEDHALRIKWRNLVKFHPCSRGLFLADKLESYLGRLIGGKQFTDLDIPLAVTAVDAQDGRQIVIDTGNVASAVRASCSVPGIFLPYERNGSVLIDGGMRNSVPADVVRRMGAEFVIGVNLNGDRSRNRYPKNALQLLKNTVNIIISNNSLTGLPLVDVLVEPDLREFKYGSLRKREKIIRRGEKAMAEALPEVFRHVEEEAGV